MPLGFFLLRRKFSTIKQRKCVSDLIGVEEIRVDEKSRISGLEACQGSGAFTVSLNHVVMTM